MEDVVPFEIAKKLKEKGFREECFGYYGCCGDVFYYNVIQNPIPSRQLTFKDFEECQNTYRENNKYDAPTISQVLKWLREEKGLHICIALGEFSDWVFDISKIDGNVFCEATDGFHSYEEATLAGIEYILDNLI